MKRAFVIIAVAIPILVAVSLHSSIKDFLWAHPWWHSFLVAVPTLILGYLEWHQSGEANDLRRKAIRLQGELDDERNKQLQLIAQHTKRPVTAAERNAAKLREHIGANVPVTHGSNNCGTLQIVEVNSENIATLFRPYGYASSTAWCRQVDCGQVQIVDISQGSCPLQLTVVEWHGTPVELGQITKWEDRSEPAATPTFAKGNLVYQASYTKPGSPGARYIYVFSHKEGANSFLLESSNKAPLVGNNEEVSKQFLVRQVEYQAEGFERKTYGSAGASPHQLFIC